MRRGVEGGEEREEVRKEGRMDWRGWRKTRGLN